MKKNCCLFAFALAFMLVSFGPTAYSNPGKNRKHQSEKLAILNIKNGSISIGNFNFFPMQVLGEYHLEEDGIRFLPYSKAPEGFPEKFFFKRYKDNALIKELYIPYSEIKTVKRKRGFLLKLHSGRKYHFTINFPRKTILEIRQKMTE